MKTKPEKIKDEIWKLMAINYGVVIPNELEYAFFDYLKHINPQNHMNIVKARNAAKIFGMLAGVYLGVNNDNERPDKEFFIADSIIKKYNIGREALDNNCKLLAQMGLIRYRNQLRNTPPYVRRMYEISLIALQTIRLSRQVESDIKFWEMTDTWWEDKAVV